VEMFCAFGARSLLTSNADQFASKHLQLLIGLIVLPQGFGSLATIVGSLNNRGERCTERSVRSEPEVQCTNT
jgi:hypothetical protein